MFISTSHRFLCAVAAIALSGLTLIAPAYASVAQAAPASIQSTN